MTSERDWQKCCTIGRLEDKPDGWCAAGARRITGGTFSSALSTLQGFSEEPLTLLRFYSDEPGHQSGKMDTLQIHLFGNLKISII